MNDSMSPHASTANPPSDERYGEEGTPDMAKVHWRLRDWIGEDYKDVEPLLSVRGNHLVGEWKVEIRQESITVMTKDGSQVYEAKHGSHFFTMNTDEETRNETYHDAFVTLEVLGDADEDHREEPPYIPVEITLNESGIVIDAVYLKDEYYMGIDEAEERCGGLPWFDDEASAKYVLT